MVKTFITTLLLAVATTATASIVTPEGEPKQYELSALYMGQEAVKLTKMAMQVSWNEDSTQVYFCDLFIYYRTTGTGIWAKADAVLNDDGTRSITLPLQYVNEYTSTEGVSHLYIGGATDATVTALGDYKMTYNPGDGSFTPVDETQFLVYAQIEKNKTTGEMEIAARCAYHNYMSITPAQGDLTVVTPPVSATQWDYTYSYKDSDGKSQIKSGKVAVAGKDVYFKGLCPNYDAWVKGTADEDLGACAGTCTVHLTTNQYLGNTSFYNMFLKTAHENESKEGEYSTYTFTDEATLTYTAQDASFRLTDKDLCIEGLYSEKVSAVNYGFKLAKVNSEAKTNPTDPYNLSALDGMEYEDTPYCLMFYADNKGESGDVLDTDKLYYRIFVNGTAVEHDIVSDGSTVVPGGDNTLVPYSYKGGNFGCAGSRHWWYFGIHLCSTIGVQQVYIVDGKEYASRIVNINFMDPAAEDDLDASEVAATSKSIYLGYSDGKIATASTGKIGSNHAAGTYECGIMLTKKNLEKYVGSTIKAVRVGMPEGSDSYPSVKVWVRSKLSGENLAESTETQTQAGWNTAYLQSDVEIAADDTLYIGYTYTQSTALDIVSLAGNTTSKGSYITSLPSGGLGWASYACRSWGSLSIEAEIFGDQAITNDIRLTALQPEVRMVKKGDKVVLKGTVCNMGISQLNGYSITYKVGTVTSMEYVNKPLDVRAEDEFTIEYSIKNPQVQNNIPVNVEISLLGGLTDDLPANNKLTTSFCIYDEVFQHNVLIEEFTTEQCGWCPQGAYMINEGIKEIEGENASRVFWTCHHAGFSTDWLTRSESETYLHLYNSEETFAPAWSLDRNMDWQTGGKPGTVSSIPTIEGGVATMLKQALETPAFVKVDAEAPLSGNTVQVRITLNKNISLLGQCSSPKLSVFVLEDSIAQKQQKNYAGEKYALTHHNNVLRTVLTPVWGQQIDWDEDKSEYTYVYEVPEGYKAEHMKVVAFVHDYDATDINRLQVYNTGGCGVSGASGIDSLTPSPSPEREGSRYNLAGQRVNADAKGIVITGGKKVVR